MANEFKCDKIEMHEKRFNWFFCHLILSLLITSILKLFNSLALFLNFNILSHYYSTSLSGDHFLIKLLCFHFLQ